LDMGRNALSGTIPSELGLLEKLGTYFGGRCLRVTHIRLNHVFAYSQFDWISVLIFFLTQYQLTLVALSF
jgi:hypothetical protein